MGRRLGLEIENITNRGCVEPPLLEAGGDADVLDAGASTVQPALEPPVLESFALRLFVCSADLLPVSHTFSFTHACF